MAPKPQESPNQEMKGQQILTLDNGFNFGEMFAKQTQHFQNQVSEMRNRQRQFHEKFNQDFNEFFNDSKQTSIFNDDSSWLPNPEFKIMDNFDSLQAVNEGNSSSNIKEDSNSYQITMDIKNFDPKKLKVKLVENNELLVEGSYDEVVEGKTHKQEFKKSYCLPFVTEGSNISCKRTSDGTLLINIEKDKKLTEVNPRNIAITKSNNSHASSIENKHNQANHYENNLPNGSTTFYPTHKNDLPQSAIKPRSIKTIHTHKGPEQVLDTTGEFTNNGHQIHENSTQINHQNGYSNNNDLITPFDIKPMDMGLFFGDAFFNDMHEDFHSAVKKVLKNSNNASSNIIDNVNKYNDMRSFKMNSENQAVSHIEDDKSHKIILDVKGFERDSMSVKVTDDEQLLIEGTLNENTNGKTRQKTFKHMFKISDFDTNGITSALSQDGVLTVQIAKKNNGGISHSSYTNRSLSLDEFEQLESQLQNGLNFGSHRL